MTLEQLLAQYRAQERFYAGEVSYILTAPLHKTAWQLLCVLYACPGPMTVNEVLAAYKVLPKAEGKRIETGEGVRQSLARLVHDGLVNMGRSGRRKGYYRLTDFAVVVVRAGLPCPVKPIVVGIPHACEESGKIQQHINWEEEDPEIDRLLAEDQTVTQIARARQLHRQTIYGRLRRRGIWPPSRDSMAIKHD